MVRVDKLACAAVPIVLFERCLHANRTGDRNALAYTKYMAGILLSCAACSISLEYGQRTSYEKPASALSGVRKKKDDDERRSFFALSSALGTVNQFYFRK